MLARQHAGAAHLDVHVYTAGDGRAVRGWVGWGARGTCWRRLMHFFILSCGTRAGISRSIYPPDTRATYRVRWGRRARVRGEGLRCQSVAPENARRAGAVGGFSVGCVPFCCCTSGMPSTSLSVAWSWGLTLRRTYTGPSGTRRLSTHRVAATTVRTFHGLGRTCEKTYS